MLKRLTIRGFKSIRALEDFELRDLNVLIGANGAGKSNFICLFEMLSRLMGKRLGLFVQEQDGPNALLFGGRKRTKRIEARFVFGKDGYEFSLAPAGDRLIFADEATLFFGDWSDSRHQFRTVGQEEAGLPDADDSFAPYVQPAIAGWRVYHFHDTSPSAAVRHSQTVRDNRRLKPDASNLALFCDGCASNMRSRIAASSLPSDWLRHSSETSCIAERRRKPSTWNGQRPVIRIPCSAPAGSPTERCASSASRRCCFSLITCGPRRCSSMNPSSACIRTQ